MKSKISTLAIAALSLAGATQAATPPYFAGTPPKMYGQWLQRTGRQKWNKKK